MIYRLAARLESLWLRGQPASRLPPLFVVGAPRSGTTVVYQHLVNSRRFAYFSNLARRYPRAPVLASLWTKLAHSASHSYESRFGVIEGTGSPSDGWEIFHRWFPERDLSQAGHPDRLAELDGIVRGLELLFRAPFINKNNSNSLRIGALARLFPAALFVYVSRDLSDNVRSLLEARRAHGTTLNDWWGARPPRFWRHSFCSETEQVVFQIRDLENEIETELRRLPDGHGLEVPYEEFCRHPDELLARVDAAYGRLGVTLRHPPAVSPSSIRVAHPPADDDLQRVVAACDNLWRETLPHV